MITVIDSPPFATVQDLGRFGFLEAGVPVSGVADRATALRLNALLGNDPNAAMIEWAVAGGALRFERDAIVAIGGADAPCSINGKTFGNGMAHEVAAGGELRVERFVRGRFLLVALRGGIDVPLVLGSRSTLVSAGLGGFDGHRLRNGDQLRVGEMTAGDLSGNIAQDDGDHGSAAVQIVRGPQAGLFDDAAWNAFLRTEFTVSRASDRTGYRLEGVAFTHHGPAALPSEPTCVGAIQVPDGGAPIVIMQDGPTVGGYPKIAVIRKFDLSRFAQLAPGDRVRFELSRG